MSMYCINIGVMATLNKVLWFMVAKKKSCNTYNLNNNYISGLPNTNLIFNMSPTHSSMTMFMFTLDVVTVWHFCANVLASVRARCMGVVLLGNTALKTVVLISGGEQNHSALLEC